MASTGIKFFIDELVLPYEDIISYFDFNQSSGIIQNPEWVPNGYSGIVNNSTNFFDFYGSGNFDGSKYIKISGDIDANTWTSIVCYEKNNISAQILFSSLEDIAGPSGFIVGINEANKLFIEYYNSVEGMQTLVLPTILGNKNIISISKEDTEITLSYFNPATKNLSEQVFIPFGENFVDSSTWYVGGSPSLPSFYSGVSNLSGTVDEFFLHSGVLLQDYITLLCSGFYAIRNTGINTTLNCFPVTGVSGEFYISGTGITGYQGVVIESFVDVCGNPYFIFDYSGVTGIVSGYRENTYVDIVCFEITGFYDSGYLVDSGFFNTLGMNDVTLLYHVDEQDFIKYCAQPSGFNQTKNFGASYDSNQDEFFTIGDEVYSGDFFSLFYNGQFQANRGALIFQNGYSLGYILSGDYILTGTSIIDTGFYIRNDESVFLTYDVDTNLFSYLTTDNIPENTPVPFDLTNKTVFLDGVLMIDSIDYTGNAFLFDIPSGSVLAISNPVSGFVCYTGDGNTDSYGFSTKYLRESSTLYVNGVRQKLLVDYVESSLYDLLSGNFNSFSGNNIYNSVGDFWQLTL